MILSDPLILPVSRLQTQQVMTSKTRSPVECLLHSIAHFVFKIYKRNNLL